ncbi:MAG: 4Fe-4S binding protein, partial [Lachnospiraceae bacterium]|nr:4Fe-4S binding protein [Lachnospiraceae bacterium]
LIRVDGQTTIDPNLCTGCGLCTQICPVNAIEEVAR